MQDSQVKEASLTLMRSAKVAYLSTVDEKGYPHTRAMSNLRNATELADLVEVFSSHDDDMLIYMVTAKSSAKMKHIRAHSKGSVYYYDAETLQVLLLLGTLEAVDDESVRKRLWQDDWKVYFQGGLGDPEYTVLQMLPDIAKVWAPPMTEPVEINLT